jgi:CMP-N,N'-diacetyllegionaminic acid synthase
VRNSVVALIPARAGSKRLANKNIRALAGHPVIAYTIAAARESGIFDAIIVSTDSPEYAEIARHYGAEVPFLRPAQLAGDLSPDIEWIEHALGELREQGREFDCFSLLRPTSPFRRSDTIQRAWQLFMSNTGADSLRAVQKCTEHPGKMWVIRGNRMHPLLPFGPKEQPWHSTPYQALPEVYVQNASLEIAWCRVVEEFRTIAGETIVPFVTQDVEGLDVNNPSDWDHAEALIRGGNAVLPQITTSQYSNAV